MNKTIVVVEDPFLNYEPTKVCDVMIHLIGHHKVVHRVLKQRRLVRLIGRSLKRTH